MFSNRPEKFPNTSNKHFFNEILIICLLLIFFCVKKNFNLTIRLRFIINLYNGDISLRIVLFFGEAQFGTNKRTRKQCVLFSFNLIFYQLKKTKSYGPQNQKYVFKLYFKISRTLENIHGVNDKI